MIREARPTSMSSNRDRHDSYASSAHESVAVTSRHYEQHRSVQKRQRFLLLCVFDVTITFVLWSIITAMLGRRWWEDLKIEFAIGNPEFFRVSLVDVVAVSIGRALFLTTVYGCCKCNHWLPVVFTATATTLFIIVKVLFFFAGKTGTAPEYTLIIGNLSIVFIEVWMMPNRPFANQHSPDDLERLITSGRETATVRRRARVQAIRSGLTEDEYRTAMELSSSDSDDDGEQGGDKYERKVAKLLRRKANDKLPPYRSYSNAEYLATCTHARTVAESWLTECPQWSQCTKQPASIRFADKPDYGRVYYLETELMASPRTVFNVLHMNTSSYCTWNTAVLHLRIVCTIDAHTDVTHSVSAPAMRGAVASRDFLDVRQWRVNDGVYTMVSESVFANLLAPTSSRSTVRGTNGPNYWRITPVHGESNKCRLEWLQNTNLRGSLPRRLLHSGMQGFLLDFARALNKAASAQEHLGDAGGGNREVV